VLAACFAYGWGVLLADDYKQLGKHIAGGAGFISNFLFWQEAGYFDKIAITKPLMHLWSLGIEEQFYIVFPALVYCAHRRHFPMVLLLVAMMVPSFIINNTDDFTRAAAVCYSPVTRFWELLAGTLLAYLLPRMQASPVKPYEKLADNILSVIGLGCITAAIYSFSGGKVFPSWRGLFPVSGTIVLITVGPQAWVNRVLLSNRAMIWIGMISYPLYLWHWPLLSYAHIRYNTVPPLAIRLAAVVASILLAWGTYWFIEKPVRFGKCNNVKVKMLCLLMTLMGGIGYFTYHENGLPSRYPKFIQELTAVNFDFRSHWGRAGCFYTVNQQNIAAWPSQCTDTSKKPTIVLWGDSHAAMLYHGFEKLAEKRPFSISQYTGGLCPPFLGYDIAANPYCKKLNDLIIKQIALIKPNYIVLSASYSFYDVSALKNTVFALQRLHVPKIVLIGQNPLWIDTLPRLIINLWQHDPLHHIPPQYMRFGLYPGNVLLDQKMHDMATKLGIDYISIYQKLCNEQGCLARLGDNANQITTYDEQHLSPPASEYFVNSIAGYFIGPP